MLTKHQRYNLKRSRPMLPFMGVDGEGAGIDELGRQNYLLLQAGDKTLFRDNERLTTADCLHFILNLPADVVLVGYYFTYDATQILRDVPQDKLQRIMYPPQEKGSSYTWWHNYAIDFRPRQYFRVAVLDDNNKVVPGSARTINEVGGFFQKSFVQALRDFEIGEPAVVDMIAAMKDKRAEFSAIGDDELRYCAQECRLLAELMEKLRQVCIKSDIVPSAWRGAGWLSGKLHEKHGTPRRRTIERTQILEKHAIHAYYGGRFEITTIGEIPGPVYIYDINSAYPAAMRRLPCPVHTKWRKFHPSDFRRIDRVVAVIDTKFNHTFDDPLCHLPVRRQGRLYWPLRGRGIYWSPELAAAAAAGAELELMGGYYAEKRCECPSHEWVAELYDERRRIGKSTAGYPLKLGLNGLYGKYAQRQGGAPWRDYVTAGLITAMVRAQLIEAYRQAPEAILYLATDALFSRQRLQLDIGDGLGQWGEQIRPSGLFIVQPGIYWSPDTAELPKTRGIPRSALIDRRELFEQAWRDWRGNVAIEAPSVQVPVNVFIGHRQAIAWGRPEAAGSWLTLGNGGRRVSFDWSAKRDLLGNRICGMVATLPRPGSPDLVSQPFDPRLLTELDEQSMLEEAAPDFVPQGNSGE
jgi:DNA polymerase type B, organellar and viral